MVGIHQVMMDLYCFYEKIIPEQAYDDYTLHRTIYNYVTLYSTLFAEWVPAVQAHPGGRPPTALDAVVFSGLQLVHVMGQVLLRGLLGHALQEPRTSPFRLCSSIELVCV